MGSPSLRTAVTATLALFAGSASAGRLAAWWTNDYGPTLMMQDDASAGIRYSLCNSQGTPIFPNDTSITIPLLKYPPKNGTALAGGGWWDSTNVIASIFYFDKNDEVVNTLLKCDDSTGHWTNTGDFVVSGGAPKAASNSDLSMDLLGAKDGYRVLYNGLDGAVHVLSYNNANGWKYADVAYNASTSANVIASVYPPADLNITLIVPMDKNNMAVSRFYGDGTWRFESFPTPLKTLSNNTIITNSTNPSSVQLNTTFVPSYTLPAWNGKPKSLGMAEDSSWTRSVFYVGTDKQLYQAGNVDYKWIAFPSQSSSSWPTSDDGYIAVANDFNSDSLRVYYMSNGSLIEANGDKGNWRDALVLPSYNATASANNTTNNPGASGDGASSELSSGAKAGIGVGVALGVLAIIGIIVAVILLKKRQKRKHEADAAAAAAASSHAGGDNAAYGNELGTESKYQTSPATTYTTTTPGELHSDHTGTTAGGSNYYQNQQHYQQQPQQIYELPEQHNRAEMVGEGHYKEAP